jgi:hypothetical protein
MSSHNTRSTLHASYWQNGKVNVFTTEVPRVFFEFFPECKDSLLYFINRDMARELITREKTHLNSDRKLHVFFTDYLRDYVERPDMKPRVLLDLENAAYPDKEELRSFRTGFKLTLANRSHFLDAIDTLIHRYISFRPKQFNKSLFSANLYNDIIKTLDSTRYIKDEELKFIELCVLDRLESIPYIINSSWK